MRVNHFNHIKLSAILPNYNSATFLPHAILSLLEQTQPFTEIIIVDDGSTDDSLSIIAGFMRQHAHIRLIKHEKNQGVCAALNTGIKQAVGDYVLLCAADDRYDKHIVARVSKVIDQFPEVGLICGDAMVQRFDLTSSFLRVLPFEKKNAFISPKEFRRFTLQSYVGFNGGGGMFINRQAILAAGMLYPKLRWHCDWLLYFAIAFQRGIYYIDKVFVYIDMREQGYSEGKRDRRIQKQVMLDTLDTLDKHYPALWDDFKQAGLLPHYALRYIPWAVVYPQWRRFFTMQLLWKLLLNNAIVIRIGRLFPYHVVIGVRKRLRA